MKKLILLFSILFCLKVQAQDTPKIKADVAFGLNLNGGNNPLYGGNVKLNYSRERGPWEFAFNPNFNINYVSSGGDIALARREGYSTLSVAHALNSKWKIIGFSETDHSYIRKVNLRWNGGVGPGYKWENEKYEFGISEIILAEGLNSENPLVKDYFVLRASTRVKIGIKTKFGSLSSITLMQPAVYTNQGISTSEHFILRSQNKIEFNINKNTTTGITYDANYQAYPAYLSTNIKPFDWGTSFFIMYKISK
jgi:hypothetical protein